MLDNSLTPQQKKAIEHTTGPAIVLAVAGAGKTTVICNRIANLILEHNVKPERIRTMTFSRVAAWDMQKKFLKIYGENTVDFSTIHSFAYRLFSKYYQNRGIPYRIIENEDSEFNKFKILKSIYLKNNKEYPSDDTLEELITAISYAKNMMYTIKELSLVDTNIKKFTKIYVSYEDVKRENHFIDYDDMLEIALEILKKNPLILEAVQTRYDYWLIDEFQDTSKLQYEIIKLIVAPKNNIYVVGDDDQTIFGWRGSFTRIMLDFDKNFPDAVVYFMEENFRSTKKIIELAHKAISLNKERYKKNIYTNNDVGKEVSLKKFSNEEALISEIVEKAKTNYKEIAILFRNSFSAIPFIDAFDKENIPFYIKEHKLSFLKNWIVEDMRLFIFFAYDPTNIEVFSSIYYKLGAYLSKKNLEYVKRARLTNKHIDILDLLVMSGTLKDSQVGIIYDLKRSFQKFRDGKINRNIIEFIRKDLRYNFFLEFQERTSAEMVANYMGTLKLLAEGFYDGISFLKRLDDLKEIIDKATTRKNSNVILSTIHSSKGLEYEEVYVVDLIDGILPSFSSINKAENENIFVQMEEERRVFYVSITRAKKRLSICSLSKKFGVLVEESRFLKELASTQK